MRSGVAWTGLLPDAGPSGFDCAGWTDIADDAGATVGMLGSTDPTWVTAPQREFCISNTALILCLEL